jgi:3-methyl-2-oxobutanoate hydroxymethyltransferase
MTPQSSKQAAQRGTASALRARKASAGHGERLVVVTAYDATFARLLDRAGADILLVGDSLGMVVQGHSTTLPVTLEHMIYHTQCVTRGRERAFVVADLSFMSFQVSPEQALISAGRLVQEGGAEAVKLEGGERVFEAVRRISQAGIPVMGHLGMTPQSVHAFGGFKVQARAEAEQERLIADARGLEQAGAFAMVLEAIPAVAAERVTAATSVPTIGIGAGAGCDGQVLVMQDLLGLIEDFQPRFVKRYAELGAATRAAVQAYAGEVRSGAFPSSEHTFSAPAAVASAAGAAAPTPSAARGGGRS